jgi:hypothetical protein
MTVPAIVYAWNSLGMTTKQTVSRMRRRSVLVPAEERFLDTGDPAAHADVYFRHRDGVRAALEASGLAAIEAERLVGDVFVLMMDRRAAIDRSKPLADTLVELARTVAGSRGSGAAVSSRRGKASEADGKQRNGRRQRASMPLPPGAQSYSDAAFAAILRWLGDQHKPGPDGYYGSGG